MARPHHAVDFISKSPLLAESLTFDKVWQKAFVDEEFESGVRWSKVSTKFSR